MALGEDLLPGNKPLLNHSLSAIVCFADSLHLKLQGQWLFVMESISYFTLCAEIDSKIHGIQKR